MNEYKITYTGESEGYRTITDRTEAATKKFFREEAKEMGLGHITIESVELVSTNAMATKRNERETLEAIRKMVEELGPQSYIATAFEGCFEDAEANIENDFGDSWKRRCESLEQKLDKADETIKELKEQLAESQKDWEAAHAAAHAIAEEKDAEIAALQAGALSADDLTDVIRLVAEKKFELDDEVKNAAERIVEAAGEPESAAFKNAVMDHRTAKRDLEYYTSLMERLCAAQKAPESKREAA